MKHGMWLLEKRFGTPCIREEDVRAGNVTSDDSRLRIGGQKLTTPRPDYILINRRYPNDSNNTKPHKAPK